MTSNTLKRFACSDTSVQVINFNEDSIREKIPAAIYTVAFNPFQGFYLEKFNESFTEPKQLFGDLEFKAEHLLGRYELTGDVSVMLTGLKGSGKSLLAHVFSNRAIARFDKPVIVVDDSFGNPKGLIQFLYDLGDAVFIFDEFAKKMEEEQDTFLDFFSGTYNTNRAVFLIENQKSNINNFILERPGRIRWAFEYGKLPLNVVKEVCVAREVPEDLTKFVCEYAARIHTIGMDNLNTIIDEVLISKDQIVTKKDFDGLLSMLNIPSSIEREYKVISIKYDGEEYPVEGIERLECTYNSVYFNFKGMENHPLTKALIEKENPAFLQKLENETYEDDDNKTRIDWYDIAISMRKPTFSNNGSKIFIDRETGISIETDVVTVYDDFSFDDFTA